MSYLLGNILSKHRSLLLLAIPLALSAYTHLWNPVGFPFWHGDEIIYIGRAIDVLDHELLYGLYDHPFLGQVVLAGFMHVTGYPDLFTSADPSSLGMFHGIPRILMGMLAVLDTFLIYKIAGRRFGRRAAVIASVLFAVMPLSLTLRMVLLDSILLPFVLASVLLAMHARGAGHEGGRPVTEAGSGGGGTAGKSPTAARHGGAGQPPRTPSLAPTRVHILMAMSGACMGCAVLVKVPSVAMIPLVLALAYSANRSPRQALLWLVPVIMIPLIWPASALTAGELGLWAEGVLWQADRVNHPSLNALLQNVPISPVSGQDPDVLVHPMILLSAVLDLFEIDPILMTLGAAGLTFAAVTRNRFLLAWAAPVLLFFGSIGWVSYFHLGMLWTAMCIAAAALIGAGTARMPAVGGGRPKRDLALLAAVAAIAAFGMSTSGVLVHWDATSAYLDGLYFTMHNYADSDVVLLTELPHTSIILSAYGLDGMNTSVPLDIPVKAKKTVMVVSPDSINRYRDISGAGTDHDVLGSGLWVKHFWQSRYVEIYDGGSRVAEFSNQPRPDTQAITNLPKYVKSYDKIEVVEWSPPEWATMPTYAPAGRALALDGSSHVTLAGTPDFDFEGAAPFSVAFWIRMSELDSMGSSIISNRDALSRGFFVGEKGNDRLWLQIRADTSERITVNSFHRITDGHWHWVVFTYDGSGSNTGLNVYVDGRNDSFRWAAQSMTGSATSGHPLAIGARTAQDMLLDDIMIYSEELSAGYVAAVHECHREGAIALATTEPYHDRAPVGGRACAGGGYGDALLAHLEFEGDLSDSSGNGNGGTAHGDVRYG